MDKTENPKRKCRTRAQEDLIEVQKHKDMALFILGLVIIIIVSYTRDRVEFGEHTCNYFV